ncbi:MAG: hypothetical protein JJ975_03265 [Bacteroidia bacterium]|nr:hypothetical protein [Bacteroidia bacterium]
MKDWKDTENILKQRLEKDYPVDDALWQAAEKQLDAVFPIQRKRMGFLAMFIVMGVVTYLTSFSWWNESGSAELADATNVSVNNPQGNSSQSAMPFIPENNTPSTETEAISVEATNEPNTVESNTALKPDANDRADDHIPTVPNQTKGQTPETGESNISTSNQLADAGQKPNTTTAQPTTEKEVKTQRNPTQNPLVKMLPMFPYLKLTGNQSLSIDDDEFIPKVKYPRTKRFFVESEFNTSMNSNGSKVSTSGELPGMSVNNVYAATDYKLSGGLEYAGFRIKLGFGQTQFANQFAVDQWVQQVRVDTLSSYYELVNRGYQQGGVPAWLIQKKYDVRDSQQTVRERIYDGTDQICYLSIPIGLSYSRSFGHLEASVQAGAEYLFSPSLRTDFDKEKYALLHQDRMNALRSSMLRLNGVLRVGYRFNYHFMVYGQFRSANTGTGVYSFSPNGFSTSDLGFGLNYRF